MPVLARIRGRDIDVQPPFPIRMFGPAIIEGPEETPPAHPMCRDHIIVDAPALPPELAALGDIEDTLTAIGRARFSVEYKTTLTPNPLWHPPAGQSKWVKAPLIVITVPRWSLWRRQRCRDLLVMTHRFPVGILWQFRLTWKFRS